VTPLLILFLCFDLATANNDNAVCTLASGFCDCSDLVSFVNCLHKECDKGTDMKDENGKRVHDESAFTKQCQEAVAAYSETSCGSCNMKCEFDNCEEGKSTAGAILWWSVALMFTAGASSMTRHWCRGELGRVTLTRSSSSGQPSAPVTPAYGFFRLVMVWGLTAMFIVLALQSSQLISDTTKDGWVPWIGLLFLLGCLLTTGWECFCAKWSTTTEAASTDNSTPDEGENQYTRLSMEPDNGETPSAAPPEEDRTADLMLGHGDTEDLPPAYESVGTPPYS